MYYPILRSKAGELDGLTQLPKAEKKDLTPIIQLVPQKNRRADQDPATYWNKLSNKILGLYGVSNIALDMTYIPNKINELEQMTEDLGGMGIKYVVAPNSSDAYFDYLLAKDHEGIIVRLRAYGLPGNQVFEEFQEVLDRLEIIDTSTVSVLFDFEYLEDGDVHTISSGFENLMSAFHPVNDYDSIIVSSGSFPPNLTPIAADSMKLLARSEWHLYKELIEDYGFLEYSDYGNIHPILKNTEASFEPSCSIKYTSDDNFVIFRGRKSSIHPLGHQQYIEKCKELVGTPFYSGKDMSMGDRYIFDCTQGNAGPGNAGSWVKATFNHHTALVLRQLLLT